MKVKIIGLIVGKEGLYILWMILATFCAWSFYPVYMNPLLILFAKRTMKKHSEEEGFGKAYTYTNKNTGTCGCVLAIDESSGRVAYVSALNPFQFQMCHANDLTDLQSSYIKGPFGGTRYVYFTFCYKNKRIKIPTFTSRNMAVPFFCALSYSFRHILKSSLLKYSKSLFNFEFSVLGFFLQPKLT